MRPSLLRPLCLGLSLLVWVSCATSAATPGAHPGAPAALAPEEGTSATGRLRPGETAVYALALEESQYFEIHLDRGPAEAGAYLYGPGVEPTGGKRGAYTWTELAPDVQGQVLWEVANTTGDHLLLVRSVADGPVPYRLTLAALRWATPRDLARHRCVESFSEAHTLSESGRIDEAVARFDETLELCREGGYTRGMASTLAFRARALVNLGRHEDARRDLRGALRAWSQIGERRSMAGTLVSLTAIERRLAHWDRAEELVAEGLALARDGGFRVVEGNALDQYCRIYIETGDTERAIDRCREAVALWEEIDDPGRVIDSLINLGYIHRYLGETERAKGYLLRGMDIVEELPGLRGPEATLRANLASIYESEGEYQKALSEYQKAARSHEALGHFDKSGLALQNIGRLQRRLGKLDAALDFFHQALSQMDRAADPLGRIPVLHSLGEIHQQRGDLTEARRALEEALDLSHQAEARPYLASSLGQMGELRLTEGRPHEAVALLEKALELCRVIGDRWAEAGALARLAQAQTSLGEDGRALDLLFEAATISEEIGDRTGSAESYYRIARIERRRGNLEAARTAVEQTLAQVDEIRTVVGSSDLRTLFTAATRPYYELYIDTLMAQHQSYPGAGHDAEALRVSERARAQSLIEILAEAALEPGPEVPEALLAERAALLDRLNAKGLARQSLLTQEQADPSGLARVELDLEGLLTDLREVERRIRATSPRYAALTHPQPMTVGGIQRTILDAETTLLEYSLGEERSFLWVVTDDHLGTYELPPRVEIDRAARCLHWLITAFSDPPSADSLASEDAACLADSLESYRSAAAEGHQIRVRAHQKRAIEAAFNPLAAQLSEVLLGGPSRDGLLAFRLAIVSDGALEYVPFAALPDPANDGRRLVRAHEVVRQPSASVLAFQRGQPAPAAAAAGLVAVVADPVYSVDDERLAGLGPQGEETRGSVSGPAPRDVRRHFTRLPFSEQEARLITGFAPLDRTFLALGREASRETVLGGALSGYRYVHFATHGTIDTRFPELSSLVLSLVDDQGDPRSDGFLRLNDVYGLALDTADMVVLSACETALGREVRGEGLVGLTRGFLYAGAERVVASLWQVQDLATARLMEHLYRGLLEEGRSPADALRHAQLAILDDPGGSFGFPYYWAGFILQGEWR